MAIVSDGDYLFDKIFLEANEHNQVCVYEKVKFAPL